MKLGSSIKATDEVLAKELARLSKLIEKLEREVNNLKSRVTALES